MHCSGTAGVTCKSDSGDTYAKHNGVHFTGADSTVFTGLMVFGSILESSSESALFFPDLCFTVKL